MKEDSKLHAIFLSNNQLDKHNNMWCNTHVESSYCVDHLNDNRSNKDKQV